MHRVFIGIPVDQSAQRQINELLGPIKSASRGIRWVPDHNRHLTLAFLGNRPAGVVENIVRSMDRAFQQEKVFQAGFSSLRRFPGSTGNIIALGFKTEAHLSHLYQVTQELLVENGFEFKRTQFKPHITLGRFKKASRLSTSLPQHTNISLQVGKITFYQSTLTDAGSIYLALKETELSQSE